MKLSIFSVPDHHPSGPRSLPHLYADMLRQAELADELGYDTSFVAEHHFHVYGGVPNPAVLLSSIALRTTRLRLGPAIAVLPFHNPLTLAEDYAMLDMLSGGRVTLGVGSGYLKHEFAGFGVSGESKRALFDENLALIERLLRGERVAHTSEFARIESLRLNVAPVQAEIPIYVGILRKEAAYHIGRQGRRMLFVPYASVDSFAEIGEMMAAFRQGREDAGLTEHRGSAAITLHCFVGDTDEAVARIAAAPFDLYVATRLYAKSAVYADVMRSGLALFGSVATVADKLSQLAAMGIDHVVTLQDFGAMPAAELHRSMRKLIKEALPRAEIAAAA